MQIGFNLPNSGPLSAVGTMTGLATEGEAMGFDYLTLTDHVVLPDTKVPGVRGVTRLRTEPAAFNIGGERKTLDGAGQAHYVAIYEIDSPAVLLSKEWAEAGEKGRWAKEVRPYTTNRSHIVRKVI